MSFKYYVNWWIKNKRELEELKKQDDNFLTKVGDVKERSIANKLVGGLYAKYCMLVQELDLCLDQLAQVRFVYTEFFNQNHNVNICQENLQLY